MTSKLIKRPLMVLVVVAAVFALSAFADDKSSFQTKGSARYRWNHKGNIGSTSILEFSEMRFRPEFSYSPGSELTVMFQPQFSQIVGSASNTTTPGAFANSGTGGITGADGGMSTHQAYISYSPNDTFNLTMGRMAWGLGDELVLGTSDWSNVGTAFEGVHLTINHSMGAVHLVHTTVIENSPTVNPDMSVMGIYTTWKVADDIKGLDVYYIMQKNPAGLTSGAGGTDVSSLSAYGARIKAEKSGADLRFEYTGEKNPQVTAGADTSGNQMDAELGYSMESPWKWRLAAEYASATKDYNQLYPSAHKFLGYADLLGRRNITDIAAHLTASPHADWNVGIDFHMFSRKDTTTTIFGTDGGILGGISGISGTVNAEKPIGSEIDLAATYNASKNIAFTAGYNMLNYGTFIKNQGGFGGITKASSAYLMAEAKF